MVLKDEAQLLIAQPSSLLRAGPADIYPFEKDLANARRIQKADHVEQRALSAAAGAHNGHKLARLDFDADPV